MKKKRILLLFLLLSVSAFLFSENRRQSASLELCYLTQGMKNQGWGMGFHYEALVLPVYGAGLRAVFGHSTYRLANDELCPSVSFGLFAEDYPFSDSLSGLYAGIGGYFDYAALRMLDDMPDNVQETYISICPILGYKLSLTRFLLLDFSMGWKYILDLEEDSYIPDKYQDYIDSGSQFRFSCKLSLDELWKKHHKEANTLDK